jgi:tRNA 2-thiouridine synthesizing protein A
VSTEPAHLVVDASGQRCPLPVITLARRIEEVPVDGVVELLADDPAAAHDVPAWCRLREHRYEGEAPGPSGAVTAYRVRRLH